MITNRKQLQVGLLVEVINHENGKEKIVRGYISKILSQTNSDKGIKVLLHNGVEGKVESIITEQQVKTENFKYYNLFFFEKYLYTIYNQETKEYLNYSHTLQNGKKENILFLYTSESAIKEFVKGTSFEKKPYAIRRISRTKKLKQIFSNMQIDVVRINNERKIQWLKLQEWEDYFRKM